MLACWGCPNEAQVGGLKGGNSRTAPPHSSGGWKSTGKVSAGLVPPGAKEGSAPGPSVSRFSLFIRTPVVLT